MKKIRVMWTTTETVEWEADIEVADDFDPDGLDGDSPELIAIETPTGGDMREFIREVDSVDTVKED